MGTQALNDRLVEIMNKSKLGSLPEASEEVVKELHSDIQFLLAELARVNEAYALKGEVERYCQKRSLSLTLEETESITRSLASNLEVNLKDVICTSIEEYLLDLPGTAHAALVADIHSSGAIEELGDKGYNRYYSCEDGLLFTLRMDELSKDEVKELAALCAEEYVVGFKGHRVILWRY